MIEVIEIRKQEGKKMQGTEERYQERRKNLSEHSSNEG